MRVKIFLYLISAAQAINEISKVIAVAAGQERSPRCAL